MPKLFNPELVSPSADLEITPRVTGSPGEADDPLAGVGLLDNGRRRLFVSSPRDDDVGAGFDFEERHGEAPEGC